MKQIQATLVVVVGGGSGGVCVILRGRAGQGTPLEKTRNN